MTDAVKLVELIRGDMVESTHRGHIVISDSTGGILQAWGDPTKVIYPRSACKMIQALPLVESGAAAAAQLKSQHFALSCASHQGGAMHTELAATWLNSLALGEPDLRCGSHVPGDKDARAKLREVFDAPCQLHNNCSGKHSGFLTLNKHLGSHADYIEIDHPVQKAVRAAFEEMMDAESSHWGIDGCSAPNFSCGVGQFAHALAKMARPAQLGESRGAAAELLVESMMKHPLLVNGKDKACSDLMLAANGNAAIKGGAEGVYAAILPKLGLGVSLKIEDGTTRGSEAAIAAILVRLGVVEANDPRVAKYLCPSQLNCNKLDAAHIRVCDDVYQSGAPL